MIDRFDREVGENTIKRIHQEDFCQAMGIPSYKKYQNEGGPGFPECFHLLKQTTQPALNINQLAAILVFNYLIGNMDAHGKNFSLLHKEEGQIVLTPFYDLVCTRVYENLNNKMAMKVGSKYRAEEVLERHWEQLAKEINYRYLSLKKLLYEIANKISNGLEEEAKFLRGQKIDHPIILKIIEFIKSNIEQVFKSIAI